MKIVQKESFTEVGIRVKAGWKELSTVMPEAWEQFRNRYKEIPGRKHDVMMDLSLEVDADGRYTQLISVETAEASEVPVDMVQVTIPKQKYIHHLHKGDPRGSASTFGDIYEWAKVNGVEAETLKIDRGYLADGSESRHELYVKIAD